MVFSSVNLSSRVSICIKDRWRWRISVACQVCSKSYGLFFCTNITYNRQKATRRTPSQFGYTSVQASCALSKPRVICWARSVRGLDCARRGYNANLCTSDRKVPCGFFKPLVKLQYGAIFSCFNVFCMYLVLCLQGHSWSNTHSCWWTAVCSKAPRNVAMCQKKKKKKQQRKLLLASKHGCKQCRFLNIQKRNRLCICFM